MSDAGGGWFLSGRHTFNHEYGWGAGRTTRRGRGRSSRATAPTSRRRCCGPAWSTKPTRAS